MFDLRNYMTENRDQVINKFNELKEEQFYNGITLKEFMNCIYNAMIKNNPKSNKKADSLLPFVVGDVYFNNSKL